MTATILMAVILPSADHRTDPQLPNRRLTITPGRAAVAGRDLLEPVAEAAEHHVGGAPPDRPTQDHAALIEQQVLPELLRPRSGRRRRTRSARAGSGGGRAPRWRCPA